MQQSLLPAEERMGAELSACRRFRFLFWARLGTGAAQPPCALLYVMLNPSTADEFSDDHTIARCTSIAEAIADVHAARGAGPVFNRIEVVNLFSLRTPYPAVLKREGYPVVPERDDPPIRDAAKRASMIVYAFGNLAALAIPRARAVDAIVREARPDLTPGHLGLTKHGWPWHPARLPGAPYPAPWSFPA